MLRLLMQALAWLRNTAFSAKAWTVQVNELVAIINRWLDIKNVPPIEPKPDPKPTVDPATPTSTPTSPPQPPSPRKRWWQFRKR